LKVWPTRERWQLLLVWVGIAFCLATAFGFLGEYSWWLDLFSHFRAQYLIGLSALAITFLLRRRLKTAAIMLIFAGINLAVILPLYSDAAANNSNPSRSIRVMLINVNSQTGDPVRVAEVVRSFDPDVLVLEEINQRWVQALETLNASYPHRKVRPRNDNFGIGLYSKYPLAGSRVVSLGDSGVPTILSLLEVEGGRLQMIATHPLPPAGADYARRRNQQLDLLPSLLDPSVPQILLGDLNTTPWNVYFLRLLQRSGLKDSSVGWGLQPSWPSLGLPFRIPLDHCLHSPELQVVNRMIGPRVGSDHFPLIVDLNY
jgi:endonuclease/exonuclease/phosphatase (EEP) superfamily protein YafD